MAQTLNLCQWYFAYLLKCNSLLIYWQWHGQWFVYVWIVFTMSGHWRLFWSYCSRRWLLQIKLSARNVGRRETRSGNV